MKVRGDDQAHLPEERSKGGSGHSPGPEYKRHDIQCWF
jgi:hypothetical protein